MVQTDKEFGGFLRMLTARMRAAIQKGDHEHALELMQDIMTDPQNTLED